ncbi:MAG TPA: peptidoglycan DD-metalloendopeptidase family protein [Bacteroidia bacterium]|jgi:murein DD-endopeptidase MepM/ murein hydrolase activator NlpD
MRRFILLLSFLLPALVLIYTLSQCDAGAPGKKNFVDADSSIATKNIRELLFDTGLCDGFDFPFGDKDGKGGYTSLTDGKHYEGWVCSTKCGEQYYLGIHTGEDWNGSGGGNTDLGQPVYATGDGTVLHAAECPSPWGNVVLIEHHYVENGEVKTVYSQYSHLKEMYVKKGDHVTRRQKIAAIGRGNYNEYPAHLHFEIRYENMKYMPVDYWPSSHGQNADWVKEHYMPGSEFIKAHRTLSLPSQQQKFVLVVKHEFKCYYFNKGKLVKTYEIALGQQPVGQKEKEGDLRVPEGEYRICEKTRGPFDTSNWANAFLGTRWMRLNYPNAFDAERGLKNGWISKADRDRIVNAVKQNKIPPKTTAMGGGIGFHGWVSTDWSNDSPRAQTWGCVSFHNKDLEEFFELTDLDTVVVIAP